MLKMTKEDFVANAAEHLCRCVDQEERIYIDCGGCRCVLVDGETWAAMVNVLRVVLGKEFITS